MNLELRIENYVLGISALHSLHSQFSILNKKLVAILGLAG